MERKWTQRNVTIAAGVVVVALAFLAAVVVAFTMTQPHRSAEITSVYIDTGVTTTSTVPVSAPALASGITEAQIQELVASAAGDTPADQVTVRDYENLGDWAAARVYSRVWDARDGDVGHGSVFQKTGDTWLLKGEVFLGDPVEKAIGLANMSVPKSVWLYFGAQPGSSATHTPELAERMPADFGFVAEWGLGRMNTLDAVEGSFTKDLVSGSPAFATTELVLTDDERRELYGLVRALEPWSYPDLFDPPYNEANVTDEEMMVTPSITYHLQLFTGNGEKNIWWHDDNGSETPAATALRAWFKRVMAIVQSHKEYRGLPPARGGYA